MKFWHKKKIVLGVGGGIAVYRMLDLIRRLVLEGAEVSVVPTRGALQFITPLTFQALANGRVHEDLFSLTEGREMAHIQLARSADLILVAPATAQLLAKMASGNADDLLSTLLLARVGKGPVLVAPAMNSAMWSHPSTRRNVDFLRQSEGVRFVGPVYGDLACGERGEGRLASEAVILETARRLLFVGNRRWRGRHLLVTAGPTREACDPVRYLSNNSSGKMGCAVAQAAVRAGAKVTLILGPTSEIAPPMGARTISVVSAREMYDAAVRLWPECDAAILAAAVSDFRPARVESTKIKKKSGHALSLPLIRNPDILAALSSAKRPGQYLVGFAAETNDLVENARKKVVQKPCDIMVANDVSPSQKESGFDVETNRVILMTATSMEKWPLLTKEEVGERLLDAVDLLLTGVNQSADNS